MGIIDAVLLFLTAPADQAMFFFTVPPPPAVTVGEYLLILVGYMLYGPRIYREPNKSVTKLGLKGNKNSIGEKLKAVAAAVSSVDSWQTGRLILSGDA